MAIAAVVATSAAAADLPLYAKPPAWVTPIPLPNAAPDGGAVQLVLENSQTRFDAEGSESFVEVATKALTPQGVAAMGNIVVPWNPETQTLTVNRVQLVRDGKTQDLLAGGKTFTVLRRESSLELAMIDGTLTATFQPDDLRVGDVLEFAVTLLSRDPVLKGHAQNQQALFEGGRVEKVYLRDLWPDAMPVKWRATEGLPSVKVAKTTGVSDLTVEAANVTPLKPPTGAPDRFNRLGRLEVSDFTDWAETSALMSPLYDKATTLAPDSPLHAEVRKIRSTYSDPKSRALAALQLVQEQTRYLYLGMNFGNYTPAAADVTWTRRFGDCKGKTALLLAFLRALDIDAEPALVSTTDGDGLDARLPGLGYFDHVFVRARIGGKTYWLDGTRPFDRDLDAIPMPNFHWALPVQARGAALERLSPPPYDAPQFEKRAHFDARQGPDAPAVAHVEYVSRGDSGTSVRLAWQQVPATDLDRRLRQFWTEQYAWITADKVSFSDGKTTGTTVLTVDGSAKLPWTGKGVYRQYRIDESELGEDTSFHREPGPDINAPYAVTYPSFSKSTVTLDLPNHGQGYDLGGGGDIDDTIAGRVYARHSTLTDGVVTMVASYRSIAPEFPAAQATAAETALRDLHSADVVVSTNQFYGTVALRPDAQAEAEPKDAAGYTARGAYRLTQGKADAAIADFDAAIRLDPLTAKRYYNRGVARFEAKDDKGAIADFDEVLKLSPQDPKALLARGEVRLFDGQERLAETDMNAAIKLAPDSKELLLRRAEIYAHTSKLDLAIADFDEWLHRNPDDKSARTVLGHRCWAQASRGRSLDVAEAECDAAIAAWPTNNNALDGRGVIALRRNQIDRAIQAFTSSNAAEHDAYALYGRSLAENRKGMKDASASDAKRAIEIDPVVKSAYAKMGLPT